MKTLTLTFLILTAAFNTQAVCLNDFFSAQASHTVQGLNCTPESFHAAEIAAQNAADNICGSTDDSWALLHSPFTHECTIVAGQKMARAIGNFECCFSW